LRGLARLPRTAVVRALVVLGCVLLCVVAAIIYDSRKPIVYEAAARVAITQSEAKSNAEAAAITSRALALATSRAIIAKAIATARVPRDIDTVAQQTTVVEQGASPIVEITVRDTDPRVAATLANGISDGVVTFLSDTARGALPALMAGLSKQIAGLNAQYRQLVQANALPDQVAAVVAQRSILLQQLLTVQATDAQRTPPAVIDRALAPAAPVASALAEEVALAGLLGLIIGIAVLAAVAAVRPMVSGPAAMAEALDTVYLGRLQLQRAVFDSVDVATVARMVVGARRLREDTVMLVGARRDLDTERLAGAVGMGVVERLWHRKSRTKAAQRSVQDPSSEQSLDFVGSSPTTIANSAWDDKQVVVIGFVPDVLSRSSLLHIRQFADSCGWPLEVGDPPSSRGTNAADTQATIAPPDGRRPRRLEGPGWV
jgi:hypothetical protein